MTKEGRLNGVMRGCGGEEEVKGERKKSISLSVTNKKKKMKRRREE